MNLLRLELRKINWWPFVISFIGITFFMGGLIMMITFSLKYIPTDFPGMPSLETLADVFKITTIMGSVCFAVFASVLLSKVIVEAYRDQNVQLLFSYPVTRQKLILLKLCLVNSLVFIATFLGLVSCFGLIKISTIFLPVYQNQELFLSEVMSSILLASLLAIAISSLALGLAFKKQSIQLLLVATIILASLVSNCLQLNNEALSALVVGLLCLGGLIGNLKVIKQVKVMEVG